VNILLELEQTLIENTLKGDMDSFSSLVLAYKDKIYAFLLKMTLSKEDAEELTQDVFISVYKNLYRYNKNWGFSTWIYKITSNSFKNYYKKIKRSRVTQNILDIEDLSCNFDDCPEIILESREDYLKVVELINKLNPEQKVALVLKHMKGFSYKEIGKILDISPEAAQMKVQRAKESICKQYKKLEERSY